MQKDHTLLVIPFRKGLNSLFSASGVVDDRSTKCGKKRVLAALIAKLAPGDAESGQSGFLKFLDAFVTEVCAEPFDAQSHALRHATPAVCWLSNPWNTKDTAVLSNFFAVALAG